MSGAIPAAAVEPEPLPPPAPVTPPARQWPRFQLQWLAVPAVAAVAIAGWMFFPPGRSEPARVIRFELPIGSGDFAVAPDGRSIAYSDSSEDGESGLWLRALDEPDARELRGTRGAVKPFWSPDSRHIGFFVDGKLKRIPVEGGSAMIVTDAARPQAGRWNDDGTIDFAVGALSNAMRVPAAGGKAEPHKDGFIIAGVPPPVQRAEGYLLFPRGGALLAQAIHPTRPDLTGEPQPIRFVESGGGFAFSAGANVLAYRATPEAPKQQLLWFDRAGRVTAQAGEPAEWGDFALSPDENRLALTRGGDLWVMDLRREVTARLTYDSKGAASPVWSPDGKRIAFQSRGIQQLPADGGVRPTPVFNRQAELLDWSPDGRDLLILVEGRNLMTLPFPDPPRAVSPEGRIPYKEARFSPDGRWIAYVSGESGRDEVFVQSFPAGQGKWIVSKGGGSHPVWRRDGRELYFRSGPFVQAVAINPSPSGLGFGEPRSFFESRSRGAFAVLSDGRFLIPEPLNSPDSPLHVIVNWNAELRR